VPFNSFAEYALEPNPETKRKDVVWFALNDDRPPTAFAGIWTTFNGDRGTTSKPVPGLHHGFLTTSRNAVVEPIRPKAMPVILTTDEEREVWMRGPANDFHWRVARPHNPRNAWQLYFHINPGFYGRNWKISQILRIPVTEPAQVAPVRPHTCLRGVSYREASHLSGK
jgi:putative SOS response-associated peptidase YedK